MRMHDSWTDEKSRKVGEVCYNGSCKTGDSRDKYG